MRLFLWFTLFTICTVHFAQAGIYRRYVRRNRPRPPMRMPIPHDRFARRAFQFYVPRPWPAFFNRRPRSPWGFQPLPQESRMARSFRFRNERMDRVPHFHHQPTAPHYSAAPPITSRQHHHHHPGSTTRSSWRPLDYGNPIDRDPTFDYAPPTLERVRFISEGHDRSSTSRSHTLPQSNNNRTPPPPPPGYSKRPASMPSLWKMLAHKQRPKRPYLPQPPRGGAQRFHGQNPNLPMYHHQVHSEEAEIFPRIPNMVYFQPSDVVTSSRRPGPMGFFGPRHPGAPGRPTKLVEPGKDVSQFSGEEASSSELKPIMTKPKVVGSKPTRGGNKEYLFTVVGYKGPTRPPMTRGPPPPPPPPFTKPLWNSVVPPTKKVPTVLHAVKTTPVTITTTHNSVVKPFEPTESLEHLSHSHRHHDHDIDESAEGSERVEEIIVHSKDSQKQKINTKPTQKTKDGEISKLDKFDMVPPAPIFPNSFNILDSEKDDDISVEEPENEISGSVIEVPNDVKPRPVFNNAIKHPYSTESYKTSTSISVSVSKDEISTKAPTVPKTTTTSTVRPRTIKTTPTSTTTTSTTEEPTVSTTTETTTPKPTKFPRLPTMPTYKKKTPVYARKNKNASNGALGKYSSSSSSSALAKEMNGSGEIVVITAGRSKVKEYKPQFIGSDSSQLLSFDKFAEGGSSTTASTDLSSTPSLSTTSTKSPLQEFDPMKLLQNWFSKSSD